MSSSVSATVHLVLAMAWPGARDDVKQSAQGGLALGFRMLRLKVMGLGLSRVCYLPRIFPGLGMGLRSRSLGILYPNNGEANGNEHGRWKLGLKRGVIRLRFRMWAGAIQGI